MNLGEIIKNYRDEHQLSVRSFAEKCGISYGYVSMLENGIQPTTGKPIVPSIHTLTNISNVIGIELPILVEMLDYDLVVTLPAHDTTLQSAEEKHLIELFRSMDTSDRSELIRCLESRLND